MQAVQMQPPEVLYKKADLKKLIKFTGKNLFRSLFLEQFASLQVKFIKKDTLTQVLSYKGYEIFKNTFFIKNLKTNASINIMLSGIHPYTILLKYLKPFP